VAEYTGLNFFQVGELDYIQYLAWRRDAFIYRMNQTQEGQEYLDNAWRMEQTEPDRAALRKKLKRKEGAQNGEQ
jgi:predicted RNA polymerase sigma factor